jgi:hypothetical protein
MEPATEKRRYRRYRLHVGAQVVIDDGMTRVPAQVLDASAFGARIRLAEDVPLPDDFYMLFAHRIEQCRMIWRHQQTVGLEYED